MSVVCPTLHRRRRSLVGIVGVAAAATIGGVLLGLVWLGQTPPPAAAARSVFPSGDDFCFAQMMMPHHMQAVEMSEILLSRPEVSERSAALADFIARDQRAEVATTENWIRVWRDEMIANSETAVAQSVIGRSHHGEPSGPVDAAPTSTSAIDEIVECGAGVPGAFDSMPGMLSAEQMDSLRVAETKHAEILYLELMIPHHEGALEMSRDLLGNSSNAFTVGMAKHVLLEQANEVAAMRKMIDEIS